jgi:hypothetical protein
MQFYNQDPAIYEKCDLGKGGAIGVGFAPELL